MFTILGADGKEYGPVAAAKITEWIGNGRANLQTRARRDGETEWKVLSDFAEFGPASAPPPIPMPAGVAAGAPAAAPASASITGQPEPLVFTGEWTEYFKIWIVNVLLTIVTLGIYAAWAKVRKKRYFYANTRLFGHAFEYLADPVRILIGNLIVGALFFVFVLTGVVSPLLQIPFMLLFVAAIPWIIVRAYLFNARNTAWRGLRFQFTGRYWGAAKVFILWPMLVPFTLGLLLPYVMRRQKEFIITHHTYGTTPFAFDGPLGELFMIYLKTLLFFLPIVLAYASMFVLGIAAAIAQKGGTAQPPAGMMIALFPLLIMVALPFAIAGSFYFRSRLFNYVWNSTTLAGHRFEAGMRARDLFFAQFVNSLVTGATLGLLYPWAALRMVKFQLDCVHVIPGGSMDEFVATSQPPPGSALGEAASDFFDIDLGFGV